MTNESIYILAAVRTPMGSYGGVLSSVSATELGAIAIKKAVEIANISPSSFENIVMGNVLSANLGQAPARQASMAAGLAQGVCATTVNKVCASGLKAVSIIFNDIAVGNIEVGVAGGMESMSQVPHYLPKARFGIGYGDTNLIDGLSKDGLTDVYNQTSMGVSADKTAEKYQITREAQDDYAEKSFKRAAENWENGNLKKESVSVKVPQKKGEPIIVEEDETYKKVNFEKMRILKPAFSASGTVTAASASPINDGASALVLAAGHFIENNNCKPIARIVAFAEAEQDPMFFTTTPVLAIEKLLKKTNMTIAEIDYFEINEAFAVVPLVFMKVLEVPIEKVNVFGGAIALGHPLGNSGSRILVTLINVLKTKNAKYGIAAICNGGGGASAVLIENIN